MNVEWDIPFVLTSPQGTLDFNTAPGSGGRYLLDPTKCLIGPANVRATTDDNSQADGGIVHRAFRSLVVAKLGIEFHSHVVGEVACGAELREMYDTLILHLAALVSPEQTDLDGGNCRLLWTPSGAPVRMLDRIQMLGWSTPSTADGSMTVDEFTFQTPFPYGMNVTQTVTALGPTSGTTVTVHNDGTAPFYPVFKVHGPCATFFISNLTTGHDIFYLGTGVLPGGIPIPAGHYAEIDTFRNTIYLDGNSTNLKAGLAVTSSDFFPLEVGPNELQVDAAVDMLWNIAWA